MAIASSFWQSVPRVAIQLALYFCGSDVCDSVDRRGRGDAGRSQSLGEGPILKRTKKRKRQQKKKKNKQQQQKWMAFRPKVQLGRVNQTCGYVRHRPQDKIYRVASCPLPANLDFELNTSGVVPQSGDAEALGHCFWEAWCGEDRSCRGEQLFVREDAAMIIR